jgi:hypothetical protein
LEVFKGRVHLLGTDKARNLQLEIDWEQQEVNLNIGEAPSGLADWPRLVVQTFGPTVEIVFRTKGIPQVFTHWWHFVRSGSGDLWGIVVGLPDIEGEWMVCSLTL